MSTLRRTMLFMPGNNPGMLQNAGILGADSVILDLEDAVNTTEKDSARILVRNAIKNVDFCGTEVVVRINPLSTEFGYQDVKVIAESGPDIIMVPKATEEDIKTVDEMICRIEDENNTQKGKIKLFALIETAYGVENVYNIIKSSKRVVGILLGAEDLTADLEIERTKSGEEIMYARNKIAISCRACRIDAIDTPFTDTDDLEGLKNDTKKGKSIGMTGKAAISPRQIDTIHEVYAPSDKEIAYAQRVIKAVEDAKRQGKGAFSLDGKMVDAPIITRAKTILEKAKSMAIV